MATNINILDIGLLVGTFGGVVTFFKGFRIYRESRFLQDTPGTPIRSIAVGYVRIHGKAKSDQLVTSPVTHTPSCYYAVEIFKWEKSPDSRTTFYGKEEERGTWSHYGAEADGGWFYLEDSTGRVLVDPYGAEYEVEMTGMREVGNPMASSIAAGGVSETELLAYVARVGLLPMIRGLHPTLGMGGAKLAISKYKKHQITSDQLLQEMFGPQLAQSWAQMPQELEDEGPLSDPRPEEVRLAKIELDKLQPWDPKYRVLSRRIVKMQEQNRKLGLFGTVALPEPSPPSSDVAPQYPDPPVTDPPLTDDPSFSSHHPLASGRHRLMECCILPDHDYDISGTCTQNPGAKDLNDRNMIRKGKDEPTYIISNRSRAEVNAMVGLRSVIMIYGGAFVGVFCLWLLLLRFRLL